jgi:hypothetical protein
VRYTADVLSGVPSTIGVATHGLVVVPMEPRRRRGCARYSLLPTIIR